jgi:hypothetical protein
VETELAEIKQPRIVSEVLERYELPDGLGSRTLVKISQR